MKAHVEEMLLIACLRKMTW